MYLVNTHVMIFQIIKSPFERLKFLKYLKYFLIFHYPFKKIHFFVHHSISPSHYLKNALILTGILFPPDFDVHSFSRFQLRDAYLSVYFQVYMFFYLSLYSYGERV